MRRVLPGGAARRPPRPVEAYTHKSTGKDRGAAETVAGVLLGTGWTCAGCKAVYIGTAPENGLCEVCGGGDTGAGVPVPA